VRSQTFKNWELKVVDDGSTDETAAVAERIAKDDARIEVIRLSKNSGANTARNAGVAAGSGKWIAFNDSDDVWRPHRLEAQLKRVREVVAAGEATPGIVYGFAKLHYVDGHTSTFDVGFEGQIHKEISREYFACTPTLLIARAVFETAGGFETSLPCGDEYDFHMRVSPHITYARVSDTLVDVYYQKECRHNRPLVYYIMYRRHGSKMMRAKGRSAYSWEGFRAGLSLRKQPGYKKEARDLIWRSFSADPLIVFRYGFQRLTSRLGLT